MYKARYISVGLFYCQADQAITNFICKRKNYDCGDKASASLRRNGHFVASVFNFMLLEAKHNNRSDKISFSMH